jgi:hypothetical protein
LLAESSVITAQHSKRCCRELRSDGAAFRALLAESSVVTAQHSKRCWPIITANSGAASRALLAEAFHGTTTNSGVALRALLAETLHGTSGAALRASTADLSSVLFYIGYPHELLNNDRSGSIHDTGTVSVVQDLNVVIQESVQFSSNTKSRELDLQFMLKGQ